MSLMSPKVLLAHPRIVERIEQRMRRLLERVDHRRSAPGESVLQVFAQQDPATLFGGDRQDQAVPDRQPMRLGQVEARTAAPTRWNRAPRRCRSTAAPPPAPGPRAGATCRPAPDRARPAPAPAGSPRSRAAGSSTPWPWPDASRRRRLRRRPAHWCRWRRARASIVEFVACPAARPGRLHRGQALEQAPLGSARARRACPGGAPARSSPPACRVT